MNRGLIFLRAILLQDGIVFDYWLSYDAGLLSKQVVAAYRWLRKAATDAIEKYDAKNVPDETVLVDKESEIISILQRPLVLQ